MDGNSKWRCETCGLDFPGLMSYINHMESPEHQLKKLMKQKSSYENSSTDSMFEIDGDIFKCNLCKTFVTGIVPFKQHVAGIKHLKKLRNLQSMQSLGISDLFKNMKISDHSVTTPNREVKLSDSRELEPYKGETTTEKNYFQSFPLTTADTTVFPYYCKPCGKRFNGEEPFQQHLISATHLKKVQMSANPEISLLENFTCKICHVNLSGPVPYEQHINSAKHEKQVQANKLFASRYKEEASGVTITEVDVDEVDRDEEKQREKAIWENLAIAKIASKTYELPSDIDSISADEPINFLKK